MFSLASLRCSGCGAVPVVTVDPGQEPQTFGDLFAYEPGRPASGRCRLCLGATASQMTEAAD